MIKSLELLPLSGGDSGLFLIRERMFCAFILVRLGILRVSPLLVKEEQHTS